LTSPYNSSDLAKNILLVQRSDESLIQAKKVLNKDLASSETDLFHAGEFNVKVREARDDGFAELITWAYRCSN